MDFPKSVAGIGLVDGKFVDEDPVTGRVGSLIPASWGNSVTQEVLSALTAAGIVADETKTDQLRDAILRLAGTAMTSVDTAGVTNVVAANSGLVLVNAAAGNIVINLPAANAMKGLRFNFVRIDSAPANSVTINRISTDTIDGAVQTSFKLVGQYDRRAIRGNGAGTLYTESAAVISGAGAYQNAAQSVAGMVFTKINLQAKQFDACLEFDATTSRFTAKQTGLYQVNAGMCVASPQVGSGYFSAIFKNGVQVVRGANVTGFAASVKGQAVACGVLSLQAGDYVEMYGYGDNGFNCVAQDTVMSVGRIQ